MLPIGFGPTDLDPLGLLFGFLEPLFEAEGGDSNSSSSYVRGRFMLRCDDLVGPSPAAELDGDGLFFDVCWCDLPEPPPFAV